MIDSSHVPIFRRSISLRNWAHAARLKALSRKPTRHLHLYTSAVLGAILHLGETVISNGVVAFQS
jgi:hypothetical protein